MPGRIFAVKFSPDGSRVVVGSSIDGKGEVRIFETASGKTVSTLKGIGGPSTRWRFSPRARSSRRPASTEWCI